MSVHEDGIMYLVMFLVESLHQYIWISKDGRTHMWCNDRRGANGRV